MRADIWLAEPGEKMKHFAAMLLKRAITAAVAVVLLVGPAVAEELRYGRWAEFCPFTCDFDKWGQHGVVIDIFMAVAKSNGMTYQAVPVLGKRKYSALNADISNVTTVWSTNADAMASVVTADEAIVAVRTGVATRRGFSFKFRNLSDLGDVVLVMSDGSDYAPEFMDYVRAGRKLERVHLLYGKDFGRRAFGMLLEKRVDAYLSGMIPLEFRAKDQGLADQVTITHAPYFPTAYVYPGLSKNNPKAQVWADMMTLGIRELRVKGQLEKILAAYGLTDWVARK